MRLGDLDALKERFGKRMKWLEKDVHDQYSLGLFHGCEYDADLINEIPTIDAVPVVYGNYVRLKPGDSDEMAKALLVEQIKGTIDELAKQDGFWIEQESAVYPGERTIGWKIAVPHLFFCCSGERKDGDG